ncbi:hypothetical protein JW992_09550 [candidate division KSB1 bacterium]|nr:hypothetical protein [candidate division KSB1 bacterium]
MNRSIGAVLCLFMAFFGGIWGYRLARTEVTSIAVEEILEQEILPEEEYINQSLVYYSEKDWDGCIDICTKALTLYPNSAICYNNLCAAAAKRAVSDLQQAVFAGEMALQIDPDFQLAANNLQLAREKFQAIDNVIQ